MKEYSASSLKKEAYKKKKHFREIATGVFCGMLFHLLRRVRTQTLKTRFAFIRI